MDLPAELRLNIYRCCLTRPFDIILSRNPPPLPPNQKPVEKEVPSSINRSSQPLRPQDEDPLLIALLRTSKQMYKEARNILYSENIFSLDLSTAQPTLSALHQRSRMQIRHLELTIPTHGDILERFAEVVRLSLRYCWGLKKFVIHMPFVLPGTDGSGQSGNTTVYANAFDILRWLPQGCEVELRGNVCEEIAAVVEKNARLRRSLDKVCPRPVTPPFID
ncbi:hypothetical protein K431DRAFT_249747 [Polychaeton citri CBS 116435]|uniref:DUF7730 domain-containing protein n=1 Tax=Polychaeton citri CBS 116435 TaxID=1314669 RepID=A0A9P4Q843_9PEZI|nr:hypothetical protein K431DRAFT_249747 [Polychaeton citri CBS 116435]